MASDYTQEGLDLIYRKNLFTIKVVRHLVQAAQASDGIAVPGSIQKTCRCGTWGLWWTWQFWINAWT